MATNTTGFLGIILSWRKIKHNFYENHKNRKYDRDSWWQKL